MVLRQQSLAYAEECPCIRSLSFGGENRACAIDQWSGLRYMEERRTDDLRRFVGRRATLALRLLPLRVRTTPCR